MEHIEGIRVIARRVVLLLLCFALCRPAHAAEPYFSVSTDRTFLPHQKITVHLFTRDVQALEFRLYRVNDPMVFFEKLGDVHGFGHTTPKEQIEERTWIERFHDWKERTWTRIRNFFRGQFSAHSRAEIRESGGQARKSNVTPATMFAQIPLLNDNQLVARWRQEVPPKFFSQHQDVPVESLDKGVYVVEATDGNLRAYTLVVVTELAVVTKSAPGQLLAFTVDRKQGNPISGIRIELLASRKRQALGETDSQGLLMIAVPNERNFEDPRVIAVHDKDVALVAPYYFNISSNPEDDWTGYVYTDRPVYRPGHTVHFRGILRTRAAERYKVPAGVAADLTVEDPNNKQIFRTNTVISQYGTVHGDFVLPSDAALGYYSISIHVKDGPQYGMNGGFNVEEYKKPEYEVRVTPDKPRVLEGDSITATIEAKYYFGEPVAGAQVKYVVHRSVSWSYLFGEDVGDFSDEGPGMEEGGASEEDYEYGAEQQSEQSGKLDADGKLKISIPTKLSDKHQDFVYRVEARVTDESRREISGHNAVLATYGSFQVGVDADKYLYQQGETITLSALAKDYDGNPIQTAFHAELISPKSNYRRQEEKILASADGQTGKDGRATFTMQAKEGGTIVRITAKTPENRMVEGTTWIWVVAPGHAIWNETRGQQIQIVADKKSYKVGDTAHLVLMSNVANAQMLLTVEGQTIQSRQIVKGTGTSTMISLPITAEMQPGAFINVAFIHDDLLYTGRQGLKVPADQQKLSITLQPSQPQFKPGDAARYTIVALDGAGKPVAGEFSLGIVDEAIYAIRPDTTQDIYQYFYRGAGSRVGTDSSLNFYFTGEAGKKPMILAGAGGAGGGRPLAQLKPSEPLVQPKVRKVFPDTALWLADVKTDQTGHATAQLSFPDSLTTWRATVRGVTVDTKVGSAVNRVIVRKNLMVRLAAPRFFRQGDDVTVSTIVHNYLTSDKNTQVSLETKGLDLGDGGARQVTVPTKSEQRQDWHVHTQNVHESDLLAKALTNEESDAMEVTLPVIPFGVKLFDSKAGAISTSTGNVQATVSLPGDPATAAQSLTINVSPSIAGSIFSALDFLTSYPYGCTEQTMSSFLPDIVVAKAMKDLNLQSTINTPELENKIQAGLDRLYDFQHEDGGWGWWKEDDSMVFMTAYVVSGLAQAKTAGYQVKPDVMNNAVKWLKGQLQQHERMRADLRAYVVYALALDGASDGKMLDAAYAARKDMTSQGLSMLGLAFHATGDTRAKEITLEVEKQAVVTDAEVHWPSEYDSFLEFYIDDSAETTAHAVRLLSLTDPESPLLPKAALWLVNHRDGGYFWLSTKQTAMVVFGLLEYVKISHELDPDFTATVFVNDKQVMSHHFTRADAMNSSLPRVDLATDQLQGGDNTIRIQKSGAGRLYWSARGEYYSAEKRLFQNNKLSLNITRDYFRLAPTQKEGRIVYDLVPWSGDAVNSGDVIAVRLSVNGSEWRYLLVEDPIPAGAEFVQRDDLYELNTKVDWWGFWFTRREFHDDHAAFFQTYFSGHQQYVYLLKIENPGKFRISPASVQPMYQPSVISTTDAATMEVKP